ncbi:MAG: nucleotide exchange factor GrpE [Patescibacteria group bacterium]|nr:nucleotide exchange factor GrpE [Patescibacteria group bacterium]
MAEKDSKNIDELQVQIEELQKKADEYLNGWKHVKADYINREKEIEREKIECVKFANLEMILHLLTILDALDNSIKHLPKELANNEWAKGVTQIKQQIEDVLKIHGVERIKTLGEKFDPEFHEAIDKKGDDGKIAEEIQSGYLMHGRTIRPAKVIIK